MPTRRLYRPKRIEWLERFRIREDRKRQEKGRRKMSYCQFCIAAHQELNPDWTNEIKDNISSLEAMAGYTGEALLIDNGRGQLVPERNLQYFLHRINFTWNKEAGNRTAQLRSLLYDFSEYVKTKRNPEGMAVRFSHRFLRPLRGDPAVDQAQRELANITTGIEQTSENIDDCRDVAQVDMSIDAILAR